MGSVCYMHGISFGLIHLVVMHQNQEPISPISLYNYKRLSSDICLSDYRLFGIPKMTLVCQNIIHFLKIPVLCLIPSVFIIKICTYSP